MEAPIRKEITSLSDLYVGMKIKSPQGYKGIVTRVSPGSTDGKFLEFNIEWDFNKNENPAYSKHDLDKMNLTEDEEA